MDVVMLFGDYIDTLVTETDIQPNKQSADGRITKNSWLSWRRGITMEAKKKQ